MYNQSMTDICADIAAERWRQDEKWGEQNHPDGTGPDAISIQLRETFRAMCDLEHGSGNGTWMSILREEAYEAFAESDLEKLDAELVQVAAVCVAWIEAIRRRSGKTLLREQDAIRRERWVEDSRMQAGTI